MFIRFTKQKGVYRDFSDDLINLGQIHSISIQERKVQIRKGKKLSFFNLMATSKRNKLRTNVEYEMIDLKIIIFHYWSPGGIRHSRSELNVCFTDEAINEYHRILQAIDHITLEP